MADRPRADFWTRALRLDPRWVFVSVFVMLTFPFFIPVKMPIERQDPAKDLFEYIDSLPEGSRILIAFDYGPSTIPENEPMAEAVIRHAFSRNVKVYAVCAGADGVALAAKVFRKVAPDYRKENRTDYVNLGYKPNYTNVILGLGSDVRNVFPTDSGGTPLGDVPAMEGFRNYNDLALVLSVSGSNTPESWIGLAGARYGVTCAAGITAVMVADFYPLWTSGQFEGLLCGMKGAAEYEDMVAEKIDPEHGHSTATRGMTSQSAAHVMIILFVAFGNMAMVASARARTRKGRR